MKIYKATRLCEKAKIIERRVNSQYDTADPERMTHRDEAYCGSCGQRFKLYSQISHHLEITEKEAIVKWDYLCDMNMYRIIAK